MSVTGDYLWDRSSQRGLRGVSTATDLICVIGGVCNGPDTGEYQVQNNGFLDDPFTNEYNLTAETEVQFGGATLTSILGYRRFDQTANVDLDGTTLPFLEVFDNRRSEEHTSELQSLMRISYAVFCLKKKKQHQHE